MKPIEEPTSKPDRARRAFGVAGTVVGLAFTFLTALALAVVIHLDARASRRLVATELSSLLNDTFEGNVRIEQIGRLGLSEIDGVRARVRDPEGKDVLDLQGLHARVRSFELVSSLLLGERSIALAVPLLTIDDLDTNLDRDGQGTLRLARAFTPKPPASADAPPGPTVRFDAPAIKIGHARVHGSPVGSIRLDADVSELAARLHVAPDGLRIGLDRARVATHAMPRKLDADGTLTARFELPSGTGKGFDLDALFDGSIGLLPTTVEGRIVDREVDLRLDARDDTGASAHAIFSEVAVQEAIAFHAEAHGELPHLSGKARLVYGNATIDASAELETGAAPRVSGVVSARHVDLASLLEGGVASDLGFDARGRVVFHDGKAEGEAALETLRGRIAERSIPRAEVRALFSDRAATVRARIRERTMPTEVLLNVLPRADGKEGRTIAGSFRSSIPDLRRLPKFGSMTGGSAEIDASARLVLPERTIEADLETVLHGVAHAGAESRYLKAEARATGTLDGPVVVATLHAKDFRVGEIPIATIDARARMDRSGKQLNVRDICARALPEGGAPISARASLVQIAGRAIRVDGAEVRGLGEPIRAEVVTDARRIRAQIDAPRIDLGLVAGLTRRGTDLKRGSFALHSDLTMERGELAGEIHGEVSGLEVRRIKNAHAVIDATARGRAVALDARAELDGAGRVALRTEDLVLGGEAIDREAWKNAHGRVYFESELEMDRIVSLLPPHTSPFTNLRGVVTAHGRIGRDAEDVPPELEMHVHTNGLFVAGPAREEAPLFAGLEIDRPPRWRSSGVDLGLDLRTDGASGFAGVSLRATDAHGPIIAFDAKGTLPYREIVAEPARAVDRLLAAPITATIVVPQRRLDHLPSVLGVRDVDGSVAARLDASGSVLDPRLHLVARGSGIHSPVMPPGIVADSDVVLDYDGRRAELAMKASASGKDLLDVSSRLEARARELVVGGPVRWRASGRARLAAFPLEVVPQLYDRRIKGRVSGEVVVDGIHDNARMNGRIDLVGLSIGAAKYETGTIAVDAGGGRVSARARLDQRDGFFDAAAKAGISWGAAVTPQFVRGEPIEARVQAKRFRAAALQPFVESIAPALDGRIDGNATAYLVAGQEGAMTEGKLTFRDGTLQLAALGEELHGVQADITLAPDRTLTISNVSARGVSGELYGDATVKLAGLRVASASSHLRIPDRRPLDLAIAGQPLGQVSGTIDIHSERGRDEHTTVIVVHAPKLTVALSEAVNREVQPLEGKENIRVGVYRDPHTFVRLPLGKRDVNDVTSGEASRLEIDLRLGRVEVQRGSSSRAMVTGNAKVLIARDVTVTGQINALSGFIDVQGRKFEIERGTVTFGGESPPNPTVVLTAGWTAADGTRVYADFWGPLQTGKVDLRSEPARPKNEILALALFGTADGVTASPASPGRKEDGTMRAAAGLGGAFAAQGLSDALDALAGIRATARMETTRTSNPRPEVEIQIDPKVTIGFAHVIGTPPITEPDKNFATVDYRFHRNWSLETTVGDRGKAVIDAIWQKRY